MMSISLSNLFFSSIIFPLPFTPPSSVFPSFLPFLPSSLLPFSHTFHLLALILSSSRLLAGQLVLFAILGLRIWNAERLHIGSLYICPFLVSYFQRVPCKLQLQGAHCPLPSHALRGLLISLFSSPAIARVAPSLRLQPGLPWGCVEFWT